MDGSTSTRSTPLSVERIVDTACRIVERDGLGGLSMRKLGAELAVDPMAVYHHVAGKRQLLALVIERTVGAMPAPDPNAPWDTRLRQWTIGYWELVADHRELTLAGLADPEIAVGGLSSTAPLFVAIGDSGLRTDLVEATAFIVVDAVHGSALSVGATHRTGTHDRASLRAAFEVGIDTIVAGITARANGLDRQQPSVDADV